MAKTIAIYCPKCSTRMSARSSYKRKHDGAEVRRYGCPNQHDLLMINGEWAEDAPRYISQMEAHAKGLARYYTGKPCPVGHVCERYTKSGTCVMCQGQAQQERRAEEKEQLLYQSAAEEMVAKNPRLRFVAGRCQSAGK